jgi:hypothetical protein
MLSSNAGGMHKAGVLERAKFDWPDTLHISNHRLADHLESER